MHKMSFHPTYGLEMMLTERPRVSRRNERPTLTPWEEEAIVGAVLDQRLRGVAPQRAEVERMINDLLTKRGAGDGKHLAGRLIKRRPELFTQLPPADQDQIILEEDRRTLDVWFRLVADTRSRYEIQDCDFYNLDKTGFMLGAVRPDTMATRFDRSGEPVNVQPNNGEWATALLSVAADGHVVPPFLCAASQSGNTALYTFGEVPSNWTIKRTYDVWTGPETDLNWLRHFDQYTRDRQRGQYRMLVLDDEESHISPEFNAYCQAKKIVLVYLPATCSHLTQPFHVGVFGPLREAYSDEISILVCADTTHVSTGNFFTVFQAAFRAAVTKKNVKAGFKKAGLVPFNPDSVISRLKAISRPSTSSEIYHAMVTDENSQWFKTKAAAEFHLELMCDLNCRPNGCSIAPIFASVQQLKKLSTIILYRSVLVGSAARRRAKADKKISALGAAKETKIQSPAPLPDKESSRVVKSRVKGAGKGSTKRRKLKRRHCGICLKFDHNARTCTKYIDVFASSE